VIQIIAIIGGGWLATRFQRKGLVIVGFAIVAAIGTLLMIVVPRDQKGVLLFGFYLVRVPYNPGECILTELGLLSSSYHPSGLRLGSTEYCWRY
jgi:MFS family permease